MEAPFSNHFVQLCHSYAGPHEEAKLPQGPNGTARITAGPVPSMGGEMSGIGKKNMLDTVNQITPIIKFINRYLGTSQNPSFQRLPKIFERLGAMAFWYFAPRHPPEKVGKKAGRRGSLRKLEHHAMKFPATPLLSLSPKWQKWPSLPCSTWTTWKELQKWTTRTCRKWRQ